MSSENCKGHERHLCELHRDQLHPKDPAAYAHLVRDPKYVCKTAAASPPDRPASTPR
ncbi:MAG: hypothetical protein GXY41_10110 [Phycisphaerae bacterium]|nr:hypothetical protein [Phycisphaerae bacterium]